MHDLLESAEKVGYAGTSWIGINFDLKGGCCGRCAPEGDVGEAWLLVFRLSIFFRCSLSIACDGGILGVDVSDKEDMQGGSMSSVEEGRREFGINCRVQTTLTVCVAGE